MYHFAVGIAVAVVTVAAAVADDLPQWAQFGVLGLLVIGFLTKQIVPGWMYADLRKENRALREQMATMAANQIDVYGKEAVALSDATKAITASNEALIEFNLNKRHQGGA